MGRQAPDFGPQLRRARLAAGFSQHALARLADTTAPTVHRIEHGANRPSDELRLRLAEALGTSVEALFPYRDVDATAAG